MIKRPSASIKGGWAWAGRRGEGAESEADVGCEGERQISRESSKEKANGGRQYHISKIKKIKNA